MITPTYGLEQQPDSYFDLPIQISTNREWGEYGTLSTQGFQHLLDPNNIKVVEFDYPSLDIILS